MRIGLVVDGVRVHVDLDPDSVAVIRSAVAARKSEAQRQRERTVAKYLSTHPGASANAVLRALGGNRKSTLAAVRAAKSAGAGERSTRPLASPPTRFPEAKNRGRAS
ncbi:MAG TPA: hypothetical protein VIM33_05430 [Gaiellaceae bacterium]